jgi:hypothetical protein
MNRTKTIQNNIATKHESQKRVRSRSRRHDPWLVLSMSIFNSEPRWNRIFNPVPSPQKAW